MSTFNQFIKNDDAYTDLYTPLLYQEKGMKRGKEEFRDFNKMMKQASRKANEIGQNMQSQTEQIKQAMNKFMGEMNPASGINKIGQSINNKLDEISCKISGIKRIEKKQTTMQPQSSQNAANNEEDKQNGELKQPELQHQTQSTPNPKHEISLTIK